MRFYITAYVDQIFSRFRQNVCRNLTWEYFLKLYTMIKDLVDEMYYGTPVEIPYTFMFKDYVSKVKFVPEDMEDEVMAYLYRPGGFLFKCAQAHFISMQENC